MICEAPNNFNIVFRHTEGHVITNRAAKVEYKLMRTNGLEHKESPLQTTVKISQTMLAASA